MRQHAIVLCVTPVAAFLGAKKLREASFNMIEKSKTFRKKSKNITKIEVVAWSEPSTLTDTPDRLEQNGGPRPNSPNL